MPDCPRNRLGPALRSHGKHALCRQRFLHLIGDPEGNAPALVYDLIANDIDPEPFINSLGGEPSFADCEQTTKQFNS